MNIRVLAAIVAVPLFSPQAQAQDTSNPPPGPETQQVQPTQKPHPSFRQGLWRFVRTLDIVKTANKNVKYRVVDEQTTRCVDPTQAMKTTFALAPVANCVSDKPEKAGNTYKFARRCDYMGAVST